MNASGISSGLYFCTLKANGLSEGLLSRGYAILTIDAWYHGERIIRNDFTNPGPLLWNPETHNRFRRMLTNYTVDWRRALDYLSTRAEIDMDRIGVIGYSVGGIMSFQLTALDPRIKDGKHYIHS